MSKKLVGFRLEEEEIEQLKFYALKNKTTIQKLMEEYVRKLLNKK